MIVIRISLMILAVVSFPGCASNSTTVPETSVVGVNIDISELILVDPVYKKTPEYEAFEQFVIPRKDYSDHEMDLISQANDYSTAIQQECIENFYNKYGDQYLQLCKAAKAKRCEHDAYIAGWAVQEEALNSCGIDWRSIKIPKGELEVSDTPQE